MRGEGEFNLLITVNLSLDNVFNNLFYLLAIKVC